MKVAWVASAQQHCHFWQDGGGVPAQEVITCLGRKAERDDSICSYQVSVVGLLGIKLLLMPMRQMPTAKKSKAQAQNPMNSQATMLYSGSKVIRTHVNTAAIQFVRF